MKHGVLLFSAALMLLVGSTFAADESFFELSQEKIKEAVEYGMTTDYAINEFGGYDIEFNKFSLGDKIGYFDILTPYRRIVGASLKMKQAGKKLSFEEAKRRSKKPVELRVFLYVQKKDLKDPIRCLIKTGKESLDISGMVMEFSEPFAESPAACRGDECMPCLGGYKGERMASPLSD